MEEINLKKLIAEAREIAESLDEFADKLEKIEKGVQKSMTFTDDRESNINQDDHDDSVKYSNNGFPYFIEELTEDDLDERQKTIWTNPRTENY
ncbi:MAG TPA: hypothetical protein DCR12_04720 [Lachnospiraceae bacterium]|nr:hypothetical protein [Lachnospiraceae bacterium]